jgi:hypothetical protein
MLISTGGIGSADEELALFPQNEAALPINRAGIARSARPLPFGALDTWAFRPDR